MARDDVLGAVVNLNNYHWCCICKAGGGIFYVDSRYAPVLIQEAEWKRVLELHPDTFLAVTANSEFDE